MPLRHSFGTDVVRHMLPTESPVLLCVMAGFVLGGAFPGSDLAQSLLCS